MTTSFALFFYWLLIPSIISYSQISNYHPRLNQYIKREDDSHHHDHNQIDSINFDWEFGLKESTIQALRTEQYHHRRYDDDIRKRIYAAPVLGKLIRATPFGDVAILARGQLYVNHNHIAFTFVQDSRYNDDCLQCHRCSKSGGCPQLGNGVQLIALWTIRRIRHRHLEHNQKYEIEYTISPVHHNHIEGYLSDYGKINYNIPGHIFILKNNRNRNEHHSHHAFKHSIPIAQTLDGKKFVVHDLPNLLTGIKRNQSIYTTSASTTSSITSNTQQSNEGQKIYQLLLEILSAKTSQKPNKELPSTAATKTENPDIINDTKSTSTILSTQKSSSTTTKKLSTSTKPPYNRTTLTQTKSTTTSHLLNPPTSPLSLWTIFTPETTTTGKFPSTNPLTDQMPMLIQTMSSTRQTASHFLDFVTSALPHRTFSTKMPSTKAKPLQSTSTTSTTPDMSMFTKLPSTTKRVSLTTTQFKPIAMTRPSSEENSHQVTRYQSSSSQMAHTTLSQPYGITKAMSTDYKRPISFSTVYPYTKSTNSHFKPTKPDETTILPSLLMTKKNKEVTLEISTSKTGTTRKHTFSLSPIRTTKKYPATTAVYAKKPTKITKSTIRNTPESLTKQTTPFVPSTKSTTLSNRKSTTNRFGTIEKEMIPNSIVFTTFDKPLFVPSVTPTKSTFSSIRQSTTNIFGTIQKEIVSDFTIPTSDQTSFMPLVIPTKSATLPTTQSTSSLSGTIQKETVISPVDFTTIGDKLSSTPFVMPTKSTSLFSTKNTIGIPTIIQKETVPNATVLTTTPDKFEFITSETTRNPFSTSTGGISGTQLSSANTASTFISTHIPQTTVLKEENLYNQATTQLSFITSESTLPTLTTVMTQIPSQTIEVETKVPNNTLSPTEPTIHMDQTTISPQKFTLFSPIKTTLEFKTTMGIDLNKTPNPTYYTNEESGTTNTETFTTNMNSNPTVIMDRTTTGAFDLDTSIPATSTESSIKTMHSDSTSSQFITQNSMSKRPTMTKSDFLVDKVPQKNPIVPLVLESSKDYGTDDIFGSSKSTATSTPQTTRKYVTSDIEDALFNSNNRISKSAKRQKNGNNRKRRINYRKFSQQHSSTFTTPTTKLDMMKKSTKAISTTAATSPLALPKSTNQERVNLSPVVTRKSYLTSISFEVNKRKGPTNGTAGGTKNDKKNNVPLDNDFTEKLFSQVKSVEYLENVRSTTEKMFKKNSRIRTTKKYTRRRTYIPIDKRPVKKLNE